jgi:hypothetical protein
LALIPRSRQGGVLGGDFCFLKFWHRGRRTRRAWHRRRHHDRRCAACEHGRDCLEEHGIGVVQAVRIRDPVQYLKTIKDTLPREVLLKSFNIESHVGIFAEYNLTNPKDFAEACKLARQTIGAEPPAPPMIDLLPTEAEAAWQETSPTRAGQSPVVGGR